jgi:hypothetical protein
MALSVHDNHLVSYEVLSEQRKIVLRTEYRDGGAVPEVTTVIFTGVEGYHFQRDCFGNILFDVEKVPVERVLEECGDEIRAATDYVTWPWVKDLGKAHEWLRSKGIDGFYIDSSVGLCGWVLARDAVLAPEATAPVDPTAGSPSRPGLYEISQDGPQRLLTGRRLIAAFGDGRELAFTLPERGVREDEIYVRSFFNAPGGDVQSEFGRGPRPETWSSIVVRPGGGNSMSLTVEARSATDGRLVVGPAPLHAGPPKSWVLVEGDRREALQGRSFLVSLGEGRAVMLDAPSKDRGRDGVHVFAGTMPSKEEIERVKVGGPITLVPMGVGFGGGNVLSIRLGKPYGGRPIERVRSQPSG